jgi:recombination protein RecT
MEENTSIQTTNKYPVKAYFESPAIKGKFQELLGKRSTQFITSVLQIVNSNVMLKNATPESIFNAAATAATLDLPINNNLGFAYIIPYKTKNEAGQFIDVAQFQLGYRGYVQLAQRSGQFKDISVCASFEGDTEEDIRQRLFGIIPPVAKSNVIIGYVAGFILLNGFEKTLYMTPENLKQHGIKFSKTFAKGYGLWKDDFDSMALKTVLKLLLSKFAPLSVEMQRAVISDQAVVKDVETMDVEYVDNSDPEIDKVKERIWKMIEDADSVTKLKKLEKDVPIDLLDAYQFKLETLEANGSK